LPALAPQPVPAPRTWLPRRWFVVPVAAAAMAGAVWWLQPAGSSPTDPPTADVPAAVPASGRVFAASIESIRPRLGATATVRARQRLLQQPHAHLELTCQWSTP
jgi:hypothetical protein